MNARETARDVVAWLAALFPNSRVTGETVLAYATMLEDIDPAEIRRAAVALGATSEFFPTVHAIRTQVFALRTGIPSPEDAWLAVVDAIRRNNGVSSLAGPVQDAARSVGWDTIRHSDKPEVVRAQFLRAYEAYSGRVVDGASLQSIGQTLVELGQQRELPEGDT